MIPQIINTQMNGRGYIDVVIPDGGDTSRQLILIYLRGMEYVNNKSCIHLNTDFKLKDYCEIDMNSRLIIILD